MAAIAASLLVAVYIFLPELIFHFVLSGSEHVRVFPSASSRLEEFYRAVRRVAPILAFAYVLVWFVPGFRSWPFGFAETNQHHLEDYRALIGGLMSPQYYQQSEPRIWEALEHYALRHARLAFWYVIFTFAAAFAERVVIDHYPFVLKFPRIAGRINRFVLPDVSAWHFLLTNFVFPDKNTRVRADVLSTDHTLYSGFVYDYYLSSSDGSLTGIILLEPERFDRHTFIQERDASVIRTKESYWRRIPGKRLHFAYDKILNINVSFIAPPATEVDASDVPDAIQAMLREMIGSVADDIEISVQYSPEDAEREAKGIF